MKRTYSLTAGERIRFVAKRRIVECHEGLLWIGDDDRKEPFTMECYGTMPRHKALALAKAILAWKPRASR
jgi:hypothetical protein